MRRLPLVLVAGLALGGCGGGGRTISGAPCAGASDPGCTAAVTVGAGDSGATVTLHVGQSLRVSLGSSSWVLPTTAGAVLSLTKSSGGYGTTSAADATYLVAAKGTQTLTASTDYDCLHQATKCVRAVTRWKLTVSVS